MTKKDTIREDVFDGISVEGRQAGSVTLNIDYQIIEHFSEHLYSSPNKAVEELVSNGFDAQAKRVLVYTVGDFTPDKLIVWDDGWSMDTAGLQDLWTIAGSPKQHDRIARVEGRPDRRTIGKFGIGKLASYVVGRSMLHLCRKADSYLLVNVDYGEIRGDGTRRRATLKEPLTKPIVELSKTQAKRFIDDIFAEGTEPRALELFDEESWTLAVVGDLTISRLPPGRLAWVLGNGLPLRPDFKVWVNDVPVEPKLAKGGGKSLPFGSDRIEGTLRSHWDEARTAGNVEGDITFEAEAGLDLNRPEETVPFVELPNLGKVWGISRIFDEPLDRGRAADQGRSHGFFIMVLGRLINPNDPEFLLHPPQYGTFNRSQFLLHVDGLDDVLLADRRSIQEGSAHAQELRVLQRAVYLAARAELGSRDSGGDGPEYPALLPVHSRDHFRQPVIALLSLQEKGRPSEFDLNNPQVKREARGEVQPMAAISPEDGGFSVNISHPLFESLDAVLGGNSKKARLFYRWYELFAVSDLLLAGHLYDIGLPPSTVQEVTVWRDTLFRELAKSYRTSPPELARNLVSASYTGDEDFEDAVAEVLRGMGFEAVRVGGSAREDVHLLASFGPSAYSLTFDAKGSKRGSVASSRIEVATINEHRKAAGADHAVVVAREFQGFQPDPRNEDNKVLKACRGLGAVSIMTVEALNRLLEAVTEFDYPLDSLREVFTAIESPARKLERIGRLEAPVENFDFIQLLEDIHKEQKGKAEGDVVYYGPIWQARWKAKGVTRDEFELHLMGIEKLATPLVRLNPDEKTVYLRQAPVFVAERIRSNVTKKR